MSERENDGQVNFTKLRFPTDSLTIADVRRRDVPFFEYLFHFAKTRRVGEVPLFKAMMAEMELAEISFEEARGKKVVGHRNAEYLRNALLFHYEMLGVGEGYESRMVLIDRLVNDAVQQARSSREPQR